MAVTVIIETEKLFNPLYQPPKCGSNSSLSVSVEGGGLICLALPLREISRSPPTNGAKSLKVTHMQTHTHWVTLGLLDFSFFFSSHAPLFSPYLLSIFPLFFVL